MMKPTQKQINTYEKQILAALFLIYQQEKNPSDYMKDMMERIKNRLAELE